MPNDIEREHTKPAGVVAVLVNGEGQTVASASDFERTSYGGFRLSDAQRHRVRGALANAMIRELCVPDIAEVLRGYDAEQILRSLIDRKGYRVSVFDVGGDDAE